MYPKMEIQYVRQLLKQFVLVFFRGICSSCRAEIPTELSVNGGCVIHDPTIVKNTKTKSRRKNTEDYDLNILIFPMNSHKNQMHP